MRACSLASLADVPPATGPRLEPARETDTLLGGLVRQAQEEGGVRRDITPQDVLDLPNVAICRPGARPDDPLTTVLLDGLRATRPLRRRDRRPEVHPASTRRSGCPGQAG
ncbi:hypothetical protein [Nonomuraea sp. NPDC005501]|uniref:SbtR family transcriptional regulator n=1 Tax=Nonomuraea sp. NPDC005501 TaxID=3156884 RepID=UPI0033BF4EF6